MSARWPKYAGDYPLDEEISRRTIAEGMSDILLHPGIQLGLPFVYFKLRAAMNGVVFKLSAKGSNNANDRLTMLGSASVIRLTYVDLYDYTLRVFPELVTELPMHPVIHEIGRCAERTVPALPLRPARLKSKIRFNSTCD